MENQDRVFIGKWKAEGKPKVQLVFPRDDVHIAYYTDTITVKMSKELAEKYSAQLRKALMDLDRTS